ncbi:protein phosphatase CheZ [Prosthecomicrobium sp. N25]|uniref:protein phosphatase CheZ n=1 Tax=Prosthecomicrobium sp. N25 TaxID=3129254 RepID=UPI0030789A83
MAEAATAQIERLVEFLQKGREDVRLHDVIDLAERMAQVLDDAVAGTDAMLYGEFRAILAEISTLKREVAQLGPDQFRFDRIPEAGRELDAVVEATQEATETIMSAAEAIMGADASDPEAYKALVDEKMILVFEACSFQDLTGQRIRKVVKTLNWIESRITNIGRKLNIADGPAEDIEETEDERRMRELILHGPQHKGQGVSQTAVDDFFASSDQDDIDKLFS